MKNKIKKEGYVVIFIPLSLAIMKRKVSVLRIFLWVLKIIYSYYTINKCQSRVFVVVAVVHHDLM